MNVLNQNYEKVVVTERMPVERSEFANYQSVSAKRFPTIDLYTGQELYESQIQGMSSGFSKKIYQNSTSPNLSMIESQAYASRSFVVPDDYNGQSNFASASSNRVKNARTSSVSGSSQRNVFHDKISMEDQGELGASFKAASFTQEMNRGQKSAGHTHVQASYNDQDRVVESKKMTSTQAPIHSQAQAHTSYIEQARVSESRQQMNNQASIHCPAQASYSDQAKVSESRQITNTQVPIHSQAQAHASYSEQARVSESNQQMNNQAQASYYEKRRMIDSNQHMNNQVFVKAPAQSTSKYSYKHEEYGVAGNEGKSSVVSRASNMSSSGKQMISTTKATNLLEHEQQLKSSVNAQKKKDSKKSSSLCFTPKPKKEQSSMSALQQEQMYLKTIQSKNAELDLLKKSVIPSLQNKIETYESVRETSQNISNFGPTASMNTSIVESRSLQTKPNIFS